MSSPAAALPSRFLVREPCAGDVHALEEAERRCFVDPWPGRYFVSELFAPGRFQRLLVDPAGRVQAYLFTAWQYLDLHVLKIATIPELRRLGLGRRLMAIAENHCHELSGESVTLEVRPSNRPAITLYQTLGYQPVGQRPRYYCNGEDALIMSKQMAPGP